MGASWAVYVFLLYLYIVGNTLFKLFYPAHCPLDAPEARCVRPLLPTGALRARCVRVRVGVWLCVWACVRRAVCACGVVWRGVRCACAAAWGCVRSRSRASADATRLSQPGTPLDVYAFASPDASWRSAEALLRERGPDAHLFTARGLRHAQTRTRTSAHTHTGARAVVHARTHAATLCACLLVGCFCA
jgi:hypothetical protein